MDRRKCLWYSSVFFRANIPVTAPITGKGHLPNHNFATGIIASFYTMYITVKDSLREHSLRMVLLMPTCQAPYFLY